jgi:hypothetical protein
LHYLPHAAAAARRILFISARRCIRQRPYVPQSVAANLLAAFFDNAPTYLVFFQLAGGNAAELMGRLAPRSPPYPWAPST